MISTKSSVIQEGLNGWEFNDKFEYQLNNQPTYYSPAQIRLKAEAFKSPEKDLVTRSTDLNSHVDSLENKDDSSNIKVADEKFKAEIVWPNALFFLIIHIVGLYGVFKVLCFRMPTITCLYSIIVGYFTGICVTSGAHRLFAHRSYKVILPLKIILLLGQTASGQNCAWTWARDHRLHHKYSDTDADPHNSGRGFFYCHMGWLMSKKHPEVISKGRTIDLSDLEADPWIMFQKRHFKKLYFLFGFLIPTFIPAVFWDETIANCILGHFGRYVVLLQSTWCVNSFTHFYGTKPYTDGIRPVQSYFVSTISSGEGWHNYHHTFPWDYKAAEFNAPLNATAKFIEWCARMGLAYDLKYATPEMIAQRIKSKGDGTHPLVRGHSEDTQEVKSR